MKQRLATAVMLALASGVSQLAGVPLDDVIGPYLQRHPLKKCLLSSCGKLHQHNNSWCSAACCKAWREEQRQQRLAAQEVAHDRRHAH